MSRKRLPVVLTALATGLAFAWLSFAQSTGKPQPPSPSPPLFKGDRKGKGDDETIRSVQGVVRNASEQVLEGAVVKLKDTKSAQVRSFVTQTDGTYRFYGLSTNIEYQIWADHADMTSNPRTLSVFDSRRQILLELKVDKKRESEKK